MFFWIMRIFSTVVVGFGFACGAINTRKYLSYNPNKSIMKLMVAFWCVVVLMALVIVAETIVYGGELAILAACAEVLAWAIVFFHFI